MLNPHPLVEAGRTQVLCECWKDVLSSRASGESAQGRLREIQPGEMGSLDRKASVRRASDTPGTTQVKGPQVSRRILSSYGKLSK